MSDPSNKKRLVILRTNRTNPPPSPSPPAASPPASVPTLPPSVEEAYRRKCIQLRQRTRDVEKNNDALRVRLTQLKRQAEKCRLERAFLLEQLAKRTSTNVEDSDGSASPLQMPKDKPLRIKRGHRKPSIIADLEKTPTTAHASGNQKTGSPASETPSHSLATPATGKNAAGSRSSNGSSARPPRRPGTAFDIYSADTRLAAVAKCKDSDISVEEELARGWKVLPEKERDVYQSRYEQDMSLWQKTRDQILQGREKKAGSSNNNNNSGNGDDQRNRSVEDVDNDVEMINDDTEMLDISQVEEKTEKAEKRKKIKKEKVEKTEKREKGDEGDNGTNEE